MATVLPLASILPLYSSRQMAIFRAESRRKTRNFRLYAKNPSSSSSEGDSKSDNALLKLAWYGSELLGISASIFRPSQSAAGAPDLELGLAGDGSGVIDRAHVVETIKEDFKRSYFVTGLKSEFGS